MNSSSPGIDPIWSVLERYLAGEMSISEFEQWLYADPRVETTLGASDYVELISVDFTHPHARLQLEQAVRNAYDRHRPGCLARDRARRLAAGLVDGTVEFIAGVQGLAHLYTDGNAWVPVIFLSIADDLDAVPKPAQYGFWDKQALASKLETLRPLIEGLRADAIQAAKEFLEDTLNGRAGR